MDFMAAEADRRDFDLTLDAIHCSEQTGSYTEMQHTLDLVRRVCINSFDQSLPDGVRPRFRHESGIHVHDPKGS